MLYYSHAWADVKVFLMGRIAMKQRILGLDLGANSIGWAVLDYEDGEPQAIVQSSRKLPGEDTVMNIFRNRRSRVHVHKRPAEAVSKPHLILISFFDRLLNRIHNDVTAVGRPANRINSG